MQVMGYLFHVDRSWIKWRKLGGSNIETGKDIYLTVSSPLFSTELSHSASDFGLLQTCSVSYHTVSLKGWTCWDSLEYIQSFSRMLFFPFF